MSSNSELKKMEIGPYQLKLWIERKMPLVTVGDKTFPYLVNLIHHVEHLGQLEFLKEFAYLSNFFWKAGEFHCVEEVEEYKKFYVERVAFERKATIDVLDYRLTDYKIFDLSGMHEPKVVNSQLVYYVYNGQNYLPYRVVCEFPYHLNSYVHYQILPLLESV